MANVRVAGREVTVSKLDKPIFPAEGLSKGDLIEYYEAVADSMLPHLRGRPLVLRRFPDGIDKEGFIQQEVSDYYPDWVPVARVPRRGRPGTVDHPMCDDAATLVYLVNQATVEFHIWTSTNENAERPNRLVVDLDPPDGTDVADVRQVAREARDLFEAVGLTAFVQATGGRGYHVVAPLDGSSDHAFVKDLAADLADHLAARDPDRLTTAQRKQRRGDRIFLDVNRNSYGQTFVAPYSLRARPGAPAATPLDWPELGRSTPNGYPPRKLRQRLARKTDPWADLDDAAAKPDTVRTRLDAMMRA
jgi:bifunctional non-homologous end joining protein LigD